MDIHNREMGFFAARVCEQIANIGFRLLYMCIYVHVSKGALVTLSIQAILCEVVHNGCNGASLCLVLSVLCTEWIHVNRIGFFPYKNPIEVTLPASLSSALAHALCAGIPLLLVHTFILTYNDQQLLDYMLQYNLATQL